MRASNDDNLDELLEQTKRNSRGYQDARAWKDKEVAERGAVQDLCVSLGLIEQPVHLGADPPDCRIERDGKQISVEVTELICQENIAHYKKTRESTHKEWGKAELERALNERILIKSNKLDRYKAAYDINWLLIHTDEHDLVEHKCVDWLTGISMDGHGFSQIYFLLSYHPNPDPLISGHYPCFPLFGA